jgi:serine/threonine protein kinase/Tol biopolymer transport system component
VDERAEIIGRACGEDEALRRDALSLLAADAACGNFMSEPALDALSHRVALEGWGLAPGDRIGAYTVGKLIGAGGNGEVWRAVDERLGREVAIKILLPHFAKDPDRLRRFADEARLAGALNHPNILTVYDVGEHRGMPFLVSECLEGRSLRQRMNAGAVPVSEVIELALAIARGLAAAHARGIVHRDLKPENVFLRSDGGLKILDFGLAKLQPALGGPHNDVSSTISGTIVGTAGYMAPEQIKNEQIDARTDLFALGVMLYELSSGHHPFRRNNTFETLHAVLTVNPRELEASAAIPSGLAGIVMRLVEKAPRERFQSALDLIWALEQAVMGDPVRHQSRTVKRRASWRPSKVATAAAVGAASLVLAGAWLITLVPSRESRPPGLTQFTISLPPGVVLDSAPVVSPDSRQIAFAGKRETGSQLFVRALGGREAVAVPGTTGAMQPFWAPDSTSIGFFARGQLWKVAWQGGAPVALAPAPLPRGGAWSPSGFITFAPDIILAGLSRVPAAGGNPSPATTLDVSRGDTSHWWPALLPDGIHFLYFSRSTDDDRIGVVMARHDRSPSSDNALLFRSHSNVVYAPVPGGTDGALLSAVDGRMEVRRIDLKTLKVSTDAHAMDFSAAGSTLHHPVMLGASADVLAFAEIPAPAGNRMEAIERSGRRIKLWAEAEAQNWPRVSPDGGRLARQRVDPIRNNPDIWVEDLERGTRVLVTKGAEPDIQPVWSFDGRHLAFVTGNLPGRSGKRVLNIAAADGTGIVRTLPCPGDYCEPTDWHPDNGTILVNVVNAREWDVWTVSTREGGKAEPLLSEPYSERDARFSPDGRWIAYASGESGRSEVSVRSVSAPPKRVALSPGGGAQPVWRRDGKELFYVEPQGRLQSVAVRWRRDGAPEFGLPTAVQVPPVGFGHWGTQYDVSPDGNRIYMLRVNDDPAPREIHVVIGWQELLK